jgi:hypothetical protein
MIQLLGHLLHILIVFATAALGIMLGTGAAFLLLLSGFFVIGRRVVVKLIKEIDKSL